MRRRRTRLDENREESNNVSARQRDLAQVFEFQTEFMGGKVFNFSPLRRRAIGDQKTVTPHPCRTDLKLDGDRSDRASDDDIERLSLIDLLSPSLLYRDVGRAVVTYETQTLRPAIHRRDVKVRASQSEGHRRDTRASTDIEEPGAHGDEGDRKHRVEEVFDDGFRFRNAGQVHDLVPVVEVAKIRFGRRDYLGGRRETLGREVFTPRAQVEHGPRIPVESDT